MERLPVVVLGFLLTLLLFLLQPAHATEQVRVYTTNASFENFVSQLKRGSTTSIPLDNEQLTLEANRSYWLVIELDNLANPDEALVFIDQPNMQFMRFYLLDQQFQLVKATSHSKMQGRYGVKPHWYIKPAGEIAPRWALLNLRHNQAISVTVGLTEISAFEWRLHGTLLFYGVIVGAIMLAISVSCIYYFVANRAKFLYLFSYFIFVLAAFLIDKGISGYLGFYTPWSSTFPLKELALAFACFFIINFTELDPKENKRLYWLWQGVAFTLMISAIMSLFLAVKLSSGLYFIAILGFILLAVCTLGFLVFNPVSSQRVKSLVCAVFTLQALSWLLSDSLFNTSKISHDAVLLICSLLLAVSLFVRDRQRLSQVDYTLMHDIETGLPNKQLLLTALDKQVALQQPISLVLFKPHVLMSARASFGYEHANQLLNVILANLSSQLQTLNLLVIEDAKKIPFLLARLDDSTFAMVMKGKLELSQIEQLVCNIFSVFDEGLKHEKSHLVDRVDIGVSHSPLHGNSAKELLQCSLQALSAKTLHGQRWQLYDVEQARLSEERLTIAALLKEAVAKNQLSLFFQPQVDLTTGKIVGAEALLRWHSPKLGMVPPDVFIPLAESTGIIFELTEWVVIQAIAVQAKLIGKHHSHVMSLNISARDLLRNDLPALFIMQLNDHGLAAEQFILELTESATVAKGTNIKVALEEYRKIGLKIAIDDFGTGYSSLAYLSELGFDEVKIDKSFVENLEWSINNQSICRATCDIAKSLKAITVAEGIEDKTSLNKLKSYGCQRGQGYYFVKPMSEKDYLTWLDDNLDGLYMAKIVENLTG